MDSNSGVREHQVFDSFGNLVHEADFDAAGNPIASSHQDAVDAVFGYTGRAWDEDVDLQYNRARWYSPTLGRWLSQDPISFAAGDVNLYRYVGNGPVDATDPSGLEERPRVRVLRDDWVSKTDEYGNEWQIHIVVEQVPADPAPAGLQRLGEKGEYIGWYVEVRFEPNDAKRRDCLKRVRLMRVESEPVYPDDAQSLVVNIDGVPWGMYLGTSLFLPIRKPWQTSVGRREPLTEEDIYWGVDSPLRGLREPLINSGDYVKEGALANPAYALVDGPMPRDKLYVFAAEAQYCNGQHDLLSFLVVRAKTSNGGIEFGIRDPALDNAHFRKILEHTRRILRKGL
ncbi:MAG: hypothetical protein KatS3mg111_0474 [Pirellulaceae bacterium]|nr:MAG: hypothetical protein KatS3mg111_0474 [Pirellulaceae bacterium]